MASSEALAATERMIRSGLPPAASTESIKVLLEKLTDAVKQALPDEARPLSVQEFALAMGYQNYLKRYYKLFGEDSDFGAASQQANTRQKRQRREQEEQEQATTDEDDPEAVAHAEGQIGYAAYCSDAGKRAKPLTKGRGLIGQAPIAKGRLQRRNNAAQAEAAEEEPVVTKAWTKPVYHTDFEVKSFEQIMAAKRESKTIADMKLAI